MSEIRSIAVIGLGLIGGSFVKAVKEKTEIREVFAFSRTYADVEAAAREGYVTKPFTKINEEFLNADMVVICTPVARAVQMLEEYRDMFGSNTIITDVGSTKGEISRAAQKLGLDNFIGGHPMAGSEKTGYVNSAAHLFENAFYILTAGQKTDRGKLAEMVRIVSAIGAIPIILDAGTHDYIAASISHVPHIIASALVNMTSRLNEEDANMERLAAGGFKDLTRIASSSPAMWESICMQNGDNILKLISRYIKELESFADHIRNRDQKKIFKYFEDARDFRNGLKDRTRGSYIESYDITIDIEDKPGSIAGVAVILADQGINVKNINIPANREFEDGCLIVSFDSDSTRIHALSVLNKKGIKAYRR